MQITGLTADQVRDLTSRGLVNKSKITTSKKYSHIIRENTINLFNLLVTPIIILLVHLGLYKEVISVGALTVANTVIGIFQEIKAKLALDKISLIDVKRCIVIRDGKNIEIPIEQIVQGDHIRVKSGDPVLADGNVVLANHLEIDESMLTGESDYINKATGSRLLSGSFCVSGTGVYIAEKIGDESYVNQLSKEAKKYHKFLSPIQHKVNDIIRFLISFAIFMIILLSLDYIISIELHPEVIKVIPYRISAKMFEKDIHARLINVRDRQFISSCYTKSTGGGYYLLKEKVSKEERRQIKKLLTRAKKTGKFSEMIRSISGVIMTLIPQGLVLSITLIFIVGMVRMTRRGALIQKPNSIESMAHVNVICMDKTGTLTQNRLTLKNILAPNGNDSELREWVRIFATASVEKNKTVEALTAALGERECPLLDSVPFSSQNKYSGVRIDMDGKPYDMVAGASNAVIPMTDHPVPDAIEAEVMELSRRGFRVLVFAIREADISRPMAQANGTYRHQGLLVFEDAIKPEAMEILDYFQKRNIELKIISGDHPETVKSIALALHINNADRAITGSELERLTPAEFERAVLESTIFARVSPQQKLDIVKTLQHNNRYVAMVGDGVNDALAIKEANLGICMGSGARVTKDIAEIILINDTFEIMPGILSQGQIIIQNVKDMAKLFLFKNCYSVVLIFITQYLDLAFPFSPQHITLFNFITITIPSTYIILFAKKGTAMGRDYMREILRYSVTAGLVTALCGILIGIISLFLFRADEISYRTYIIGAICIMGAFNFLYIYTWPKKAHELADIKAGLLALFCLAILPAAMYLFVPVNEFFTLKRLTPMDWAGVASISAIGIVATYLICKYDVLFKLFTPSEAKAWAKSGKVDRRVNG